MQTPAEANVDNLLRKVYEMEPISAFPRPPKQDEGVPGLIIGVILWSTFLAGFVLGIIASGSLTVHLRP